MATALPGHAPIAGIAELRDDEQCRRVFRSMKRRQRKEVPGSGSGEHTRRRGQPPRSWQILLELLGDILGQGKPQPRPACSAESRGHIDAEPAVATCADSWDPSRQGQDASTPAGSGNRDGQPAGASRGSCDSQSRADDSMKDSSTSREGHWTPSEPSRQPRIRYWKWIKRIIALRAFMLVFLSRR